MKKIFLLFVLLGVLIMSCQNKKVENQEETIKTEQQETKLVKIDVTEIPDNVVKLISQDWMLITSGNSNSFNTMTASWGFLGEIWGKHSSIIAVRDSRYTYEFLENNDTYTLSFFSEDYRDALNICGTRSGRDTDKIKESGLTPKKMDSGLMSFEEARLIIECRKLYSEPFQRECFADKSILEKIYDDETSMHTMYIGEIMNVWMKK